jgi:hypothetical protein
MVLRNVAKTFSLEEQRQEINEIAVDLDAVNTTLTNWNATQWDTAYSWGDHAQAGYWVDNSTSRTNWDTAYGWGDHGTVGYLVATSASYNNTNWDTAYGWGDHAQGGYLTAYQTDAQIKTSYEANADTNAFTDALLTKLNGIETSATADQTGAEIKTAYEGEADTNAFTDALLTKLNGIADGAEVNLDPGGTYAGTGTAQDPAIGSIQFKNFGNIFGGDSLFVWNNTDNHLGIGTGSPLKRVHLASAGDVHLALQDTSANANTQMWEMSVGQNPSGQSEYVLRSRNDDGTGGNERLRVTWDGQIVTQGNSVNDFTGVIYAPGNYSVFGNTIAGKVPDSANNNTEYILLHKLGQSQGMQFAGAVIVNSYTGSAYIDCHITARHNDDAINYTIHHSSNPGITKVNVFLTTVTYNGDTWLTLRKNGGGTGVMYLNGFYSGNANNAGYGGLKALVPSAITSPTDIVQLNP